MCLKKVIYCQTKEAISMKAVALKEIPDLESGIIHTVYDTTSTPPIGIMPGDELIDRLGNRTPYKVINCGEGIILSIPFSKSEGDELWSNEGYYTALDITWGLYVGTKKKFCTDLQNVWWGRPFHYGTHWFITAANKTIESTIDKDN